MQWKLWFLAYMTFLKPLTLVTSFCFLGSFSWLLRSYSFWVTGSPLSSHTQMTPMSVLSAQATLPNCTLLPNCLQDNLHLTDLSANISKMEPITFSPYSHQADVSCPGDSVHTDSSGWRALLSPLTLWALHLANHYSSFRSQGRCHFFWEVFLHTSSVSHVLLWFQKLPLVMLY